MPPKKGSTAASARKNTSSIAQAFKPQAKRSTASHTATGKAAALTKSDSVSKLRQPAPASRSVSPEKQKSDGQVLTQDELEQADSLPQLDVHDRRWDGMWRSVKTEKLGKVGPIHAQDENRIHHILRTFDLDPTYGPCLGMSRMERWNRAHALGEDPPQEVHDILMTREGVLEQEYRDNCLAGTGV